MEKVRVLTDSTCDIPAEMQKKYDVDILCFDIALDGQSYTERVDFTPEEYYELLEHCEGLPSTAHITALRFANQFEAYARENYTDVIYISINSAGSATRDAARIGYAQFQEDNPESKMRVHVIDSHSYSMAYGLYACYAAEKLKKGATVDSVVDYLEDAFARTEILLGVYNLRFVKKSGRISAAAAFAGELLGLRPIISMVDDGTKTVSKVRGDDAVAGALLKQAAPRIDLARDYMVAGTSMENMKYFAKVCKKEFGKAPQGCYLLGAAVASNTGPHALAIIYAGEKRTRGAEE